MATTQPVIRRHRRLLEMMALCLAASARPALAQLRIAEPITFHQFVGLQAFFHANSALPQVVDFLAANPSLSPVLQMNFTDLTDNAKQVLGQFGAHLPRTWDAPAVRPEQTLARVARAYKAAQEAVRGEMDDRVIKFMRTGLLEWAPWKTPAALHDLARQLGAYTLYGQEDANYANGLAARLLTVSSFDRALEIADELNIGLHDIQAGGWRSIVVWVEGKDPSRFGSIRSRLMRQRTVYDEDALRVSGRDERTILRHWDTPDAQLTPHRKMALHAALNAVRPYHHTDLTEEELYGDVPYSPARSQELSLRIQGLSARYANELIQLERERPERLSFLQLVRFFELRCLITYYYYSDITFAEIRQLALILARGDGSAVNPLLRDDGPKLIQLLQRVGYTHVEILQFIRTNFEEAGLPRSRGRMRARQPLARSFIPTSSLPEQP